MYIIHMQFIYSRFKCEIEFIFILLQNIVPIQKLSLE